jgi:hypothetical protein
MELLFKEGGFFLGRLFFWAYCQLLFGSHVAFGL